MRRSRRRDPWRRKAARLAEEFIAHYAEETGESLDLSLDRIRDLDRYLERHFEGEPLPQEIVSRAGYYFAEIWRRAFGGKYIWDESKGVLAIRHKGVSVFPVEKVSRTVRSKTPGALEAFAFVYARKLTET